MSTYGLVKALLLPPASLVLLGVVGALVARRRRRVGLAMMGTAGLVAALLSVPFVSWTLMSSLQTSAAIPPDARTLDADVIVVLSGDFDADPPEWGRDEPGGLSLERLRYGAALARRTGLPLLLSGGVARPDREPLAVRFAPFVRDELGVPVRWLETRSGTTAGNARFTAELLRAEAPDLRRVALVTHAWHMPRAQAAFERNGLEVLPAPLSPVPPPNGLLEGLLPAAKSFHQSYFAIHEWLGIVYYAIRG